MNDDDDFYTRYSPTDQPGTDLADEEAVDDVARSDDSPAPVGVRSDWNFDPEETSIVNAEFVRAEVRAPDELPREDTASQHADNGVGHHAESDIHAADHQSAYSPGGHEVSGAADTSVEPPPQDGGVPESTGNRPQPEPSLWTATPTPSSSAPPSPETYGWAVSPPTPPGPNRLHTNGNAGRHRPISGDDHLNTQSPPTLPPPPSFDGRMTPLPPGSPLRSGDVFHGPAQGPAPASWGAHPNQGHHYGAPPPHFGEPWPSRPAAPPRYRPPRQQPRLDDVAHTGASVGSARATIREAELVRARKPEPQRGWRRVLRQTTRINLGPSPAERKWNDLQRRINTNLRGSYLVAVMGEKGGVSKTTVTVGLGAALAHYRDDKVVAIDGNPAKGNLADRINEPSTGSWKTLVTDQHLQAYSDFRAHLGRDETSGLEVLGTDTSGGNIVTGADLTVAWQLLQRQYPVGLIDCGNQLRDDVVQAVLNMVQGVVIVSTTRLDGARGAESTINFLLQHGYPHLAASAVVIISNITKQPANKAVRHLHEDFERTVRAVHAIPYDPHLHEAAAVDRKRLKPATRRAFIEAAASVADGFAGAADHDNGALGRPGPTEWRR
ncbi:MinD/ParA family ATP-binding protein [Mycolicibacterium goodii]|uniref:MinD/ParA family ATP-binding protein n=1 Tax=Mycolicibacterium goodii TaxID=134601 RepID=UPI0027DFC193|nr:MinD/ParA family protein [Mycolicibacterium goodii]